VHAGVRARAERVFAAPHSLPHARPSSSSSASASQDPSGNPSSVPTKYYVPGRKDFANVYEKVCVVLTQLFANYLTSAFVVLGGKEALALWASLHWAGHGLTLAAHVALSVLVMLGVAGAAKPKVKKS
jgi:hypothetical protein